MKDPMKCFLNLEKILQDPRGSNRTPDKTPVKSLLILVKILWDLRQDFERLNSILSILDMES